MNSVSKSVYSLLSSVLSLDWASTTQGQGQGYFTTDSLPPISSSRRRAPWDSRPEFFSHLNTCGHSPYITTSLTRGWVCHLQVLLALISSFILGSESRRTRDHVLLSQIRDVLFVASCDSQGYGGGIRHRLHTGFLLLGRTLESLYLFL
jgi:translation elongation factor EF-Tu-like GTPase